jgi:hypothetical protein
MSHRWTRSGNRKNIKRAGRFRAPEPSRIPKTREYMLLLLDLARVPSVYQL